MSEPTSSESPRTVVPDGTVAVTPWVIVEDASSFLAFLADVFSAQEVVRLPGSDGLVQHAEARINGVPVMVFDRRPGWGPTPAFLRVYVGDVDDVLARGAQRGAVTVTPPATEWFGDRVARMRDPWNNLWWLHEPVFEPTPEQFAEGQPQDPESRERLEQMASTLDAELRRRA